MKFRSVVFMFLVFGLIMINVSSVFAISAAIGNGRMILRGDVGDVVERYVKVINQNDFDVVINISVSGDLEKYVSLVDESFVLSSGEEKKAYFNIEFAKSGTSNVTNINVQFTEVGGEGGAGLSSSVIVIAEGDDSGYDNGEDNDEDSEGIGGVVDYITGSVVGIRNRSNLVVGGLVITMVIFIVFLVVLILYSKKKEMEKIGGERHKDKSGKGNGGFEKGENDLKKGDKKTKLKKNDRLDE